MKTFDSVAVFYIQNVHKIGSATVYLVSKQYKVTSRWSIRFKFCRLKLHQFKFLRPYIYSVERSLAYTLLKYYYLLDSYQTESLA